MRCRVGFARSAKCRYPVPAPWSPPPDRRAEARRPPRGSAARPPDRWRLGNRIPMQGVHLDFKRYSCDLTGHDDLLFTGKIFHHCSVPFDAGDDLFRLPVLSLKFSGPGKDAGMLLPEGFQCTGKVCVHVAPDEQRGCLLRQPLAADLCKCGCLAGSERLELAGAHVNGLRLGRKIGALREGGASGCPACICHPSSSPSAKESQSS